jgi:hypothetical protein
MVTVRNDSNRPIRNVTCKIEASPAGATVVHDKVADITGPAMDVQIHRRLVSEPALHRPVH